LNSLPTQISIYWCRCRTYWSLWLLWLWLYGDWIYNYLYNHCLSTLKLWVRIPLMARCTPCKIMW